ncbi:HNH endonuclease [Proteiniphilum acetatigenes]|uniref:HNH endonuclease n=1 Tax=Proteiniphilum acetatigenes TaxID=294710 RepID=UPI0012FB2446
MQNPLCEKCFENGIITAACDIHHIISFVDITDNLRRLEIAYDFNNLQSLCKKCHQKIHNQ